MDVCARVLASLAAQPAPRRYVVALSGGGDSAALLAILADRRAHLAAPLAAVHVNHRLQADADAWEAGCAALCARLRVPFASTRLETAPPPGASIEDWARRERYRALRAHLTAGDALLTAHHAEDQAETVLLALLRGAGPHGLRGMPAARDFAPGTLLRPALDLPAAQLRACARAWGVEWIEDPSNVDLRHDRNYLRREIWPRLGARFPGAASALARAARLQADVAREIDAVAAADLAAARLDDGSVAVSVLRALPPERAGHALRHWIRACDRRAPSYVRTRAALADLLGARWDRRPCFAWADGELRRHRDRIHLLPRLSPAPRRVRIPWVPPREIAIPGGAVYATATDAGGLRPTGPGARVEIGFRAGGERARLPGRAFRSELKRLFQAARVPPWERDRTPLVFVDGDLAAAVGRWVFEPYWAAPGTPAWSLHWRTDFRAAPAPAGPPVVR
jgi:tRNA(Ile)-lysidine synthase